jgi:hypothetical protein
VLQLKLKLKCAVGVPGGCSLGCCRSVPLLGVGVLLEFCPHGGTVHVYGVYGVYGVCGVYGVYGVYGGYTPVLPITHDTEPRLRHATSRYVTLRHPPFYPPFYPPWTGSLHPRSLRGDRHRNRNPPSRSGASCSYGSPIGYHNCDDVITADDGKMQLLAGCVRLPAFERAECPGGASNGVLPKRPPG